MEKHLEDFFPPGTEEHGLLLQIDLDRLPRHIAVIMDGNGRWAEQRRPAPGRGPQGRRRRPSARSSRPRPGSASAILTLYAFSSENWKRPRTEVGRLWRLLREIPRQGATGSSSRTTSGSRSSAGERASPAAALKELERVEALTRANRRMTARRRPQLRRPRRDRGRGPADPGRGAHPGRPPRRKDLRRPPLDRGHARSRPPHPDERRDAGVELPPLADRLRRDRRHARPLAGFPAGATCSRPSSNIRGGTAGSGTSAPPPSAPAEGHKLA